MNAMSPPSPDPGRGAGLPGAVSVRPVRLRLSRRRGFDLQALSRATNGLRCVSVARPTLYGNPFVHDDPAQAVEAFRCYCRGGTQSFEMGPTKLRFAPKLHRNSLHHAWSEWLREEGLPAISGNNLACWCALDAPCHGDVLLKLAAARQAIASAAPSASRDEGSSRPPDPA